MKKFEFDVQLDAEEITDDLADLVFEAGCDDAVLCKTADFVYISFERVARSRAEAIEGALRALELAGVPFIADIRCAS